MTNPVILLGTQSNGETLPVQVDATGRLVAQGLKGDPGDPALGLPPYDGIPDGYLLMIDDGEPKWMPDPNTPPIVWSDYCTPTGGSWYAPDKMPQWGFDGNLENQVFATGGNGWQLQFPEPLTVETLEIYSIYGRGNTRNYSLSGMSGEITVQTGEWQVLPRLFGTQVQAGDRLRMTPSTPVQCSFTGIRLNGEILLDPVAEFRNRVKETVKSVLSEVGMTTDIDLT